MIDTEPLELRPVGVLDCIYIDGVIVLYSTPFTPLFSPKVSESAQKLFLSQVIYPL